MQNQHQQDASRLKVELAQAENRTKNLQKEVLRVCCSLSTRLDYCYNSRSLSLSPQYEDTQSQLSDLRQRYEQTEQEKRCINDELEQCKVNLKLLQEQGKNVSAHTSPTKPQTFSTESSQCCCQSQCSVFFFVLLIVQCYLRVQCRIRSKDCKPFSSFFLTEGCHNSLPQTPKAVRSSF